MATEGFLSSKLDITQMKNGNYFEKFLKSRLSWSKEKWDTEGDAHSKLHKLVNSMRYWHKKLLKAYSNTNIIVTVYNETRDAFITLDEVVDAILLLDPNIKITGYTSFRNPRYISLSFETKVIRDFVQNNLKMVGEHNVVFLNWACGEQTLFIRVHWYPDEMDVVHVKSLLGKYFIITEMIREDTTIMNGMKLKSGIVYCKGNLKKDGDLDAVPHLVDLQGLECLLTIWGRKYLCLTCNKVGHRARECPTPYCRKCKSLMIKNHDCNLYRQHSKSYAQKLKGVDLDSYNDAAYEDNSSAAIICINNDIRDTSSLPQLSPAKNISNLIATQCNIELENSIVNVNQASTSDFVSNTSNANDNLLDLNRKQVSKNPVNKAVSDQRNTTQEVFEFSSGSGESSEDEGTGNQALVDLGNHLLELQKISSNVSSIGIDTTKFIEGNSEMATDQSSLKRKLDLPPVAFSENLSRAGPMKTYSRKASKASNPRTLKKK